MEIGRDGKVGDFCVLRHASLSLIGDSTANRGFGKKKTSLVGIVFFINSKRLEQQTILPRSTQLPNQLCRLRVWTIVQGTLRQPAALSFLRINAFSGKSTSAVSKTDQIIITISTIIITIISIIISNIISTIVTIIIVTIIIIIIITSSASVATSSASTSLA